jgi:hypothetical protein
LDGNLVANFTMATWAENNIGLAQKFFQENLPDYQIRNTSTHGPYWSLEAVHAEIRIRIGGDVGFNIEVYIDGAKYQLWQYDKSVSNVTDTNEANILFALGVLKKFLTHTDSGSRDLDR